MVVAIFHAPDIRNLKHHYAVARRRADAKLSSAWLVIPITEAMVDTRTVRKMIDIEAQLGISNRHR